MYEVTYAEYMKLLTNQEMPGAAHEVMSLNKILTRFYNNECITTDEIVTSLNNCQKDSNDKLKILRM